MLSPLPCLLQGVPGALGYPWEHPLFPQGLGSGPPLCWVMLTPLSSRISWSSFGVGVKGSHPSLLPPSVPGTGVPPSPHLGRGHLRAVIRSDTHIPLNPCHAAEGQRPHG